MSAVSDALFILEGESQRVHDMLNCGPALTLWEARPSENTPTSYKPQLPMNNVLLQEVCYTDRRPAIHCLLGFQLENTRAELAEVKAAREMEVPAPCGSSIHPFPRPDLTHCPGPPQTAMFQQAHNTTTKLMDLHARAMEMEVGPDRTENRPVLLPYEACYDEELSEEPLVSPPPSAQVGRGGRHCRATELSPLYSAPVGVWQGERGGYYGRLEHRFPQPQEASLPSSSQHSPRHTSSWDESQTGDQNP